MSGPLVKNVCAHTTTIIEIAGYLSDPDEMIRENTLDVLMGWW
jgi:hypothetical protein